MLTRPKFRFSLLSLLLLTALVGVGVSHWLTTLRLRNAEEVSREQRQVIRGLNDDLKRLTVDDPSRVHVIATRESENHWKSNTGFVPVHQMGWQVHLPGMPFPENPEWHLCWAIGDIPAKGFPTDPIDEVAIDTGLDSQIAISVEFSDGRTRGWSARIAFGDNEKLHLMDDAYSDWLKEASPWNWRARGSDLRAARVPLPPNPLAPLARLFCFGSVECPVPGILGRWILSRLRA